MFLFIWSGFLRQDENKKTEIIGTARCSCSQSFNTIKLIVQIFPASCHQNVYWRTLWGGQPQSIAGLDTIYTIWKLTMSWQFSCCLHSSFIVLFQPLFLNIHIHISQVLSTHTGPYQFIAVFVFTFVFVFVFAFVFVFVFVFVFTFVFVFVFAAPIYCWWSVTPVLQSALTMSWQFSLCLHSLSLSGICLYSSYLCFYLSLTAPIYCWRFLQSVLTMSRLFCVCLCIMIRRQYHHRHHYNHCHDHPLSSLSMIMIFIIRWEWWSRDLERWIGAQVRELPELKSLPELLLRRRGLYGGDL